MSSPKPVVDSKACSPTSVYSTPDTKSDARPEASNTTHLQYENNEPSASVTRELSRDVHTFSGTDSPSSDDRPDIFPYESLIEQYSAFTTEENRERA